MITFIIGCIPIIIIVSILSIEEYKNKDKLNTEIDLKIAKKEYNRKGKRYSKKDYITIKKEISNTIIATIMSLVVWFTLLTIITMFSALFIPTRPCSYQFDIASLKDNTIGYSKEKLSYFYMIETDEGFVVENITSEDVYIQYDDTCNPHIVVNYYEAIIPNWYDLVFLSCVLETDYKENNIKSYYIVVPSGTVVEEYNVDLE